MGILDDAIREHLDLKRRQGAAEDELQRLEDEAFGPPSRPGDPDFAERGPDSEQTGAPESEGNGNGAEAPAADATMFHDPDADAGPEAGIAEAPATDEVRPFDAEDAGAEEIESPAAAAEDATPLASEPTVQHDTLGSEGGVEDVDLDLDLNLEEEIEDAGELDLDDEDVEEVGSAEEPAAGAASATEEPIESLDTVEHHFDDAIDEAEVVEDEPERVTGDSDEDDDVLEETPEFLRDAPEDDELWFEQGEPKDFDF